MTPQLTILTIGYLFPLIMCLIGAKLGKDDFLAKISVIPGTASKRSTRSY